MYENEIFDLSPSPHLPSWSGSRRNRLPKRIRIASSEEIRNRPRYVHCDPRTLNYSAGGPTRQERVLYIKAMVNGSNFGLFDVQVTQQQGQFAYVEAKDIDDIINGIQVVRCQSIWQGSLIPPTPRPSTIQYFWPAQPGQPAVRPSPLAPRIIDGLKAQVAKMVANTSFMVRPTAIWVNPIVGDLIDREAKAQQITMNTVEVVGGVKVKALSTQAGELPILSDPSMPSTSLRLSGGAYGFSAAPAGPTRTISALHPHREPHLPRPLHRRRQPRQRRHPAKLFQLGLVGDLQKKFVAVLFRRRFG